MNNKDSICIATYFDKKFEKIGNLCLRSVNEYGKRFNIDVIKYEGNLSNRPPAWNKILVVKNLLKKYDFVIWIDADAVFVRFDEDIRNEIDEGKDFYISLVNFKGRLVPNSGFFIFRKTKWSLNFIDKIWNMKEYIYHNYWENAAIIDLLGYKEIMLSNKYKLVINKYQYKLGIKGFTTKLSNKLRITRVMGKVFSKNSGKLNFRENGIDLRKVKWIDTKWNSLPGKSESKNPIVNHYPSMPYSERLEFMSRDVKELHTA